MMRYLKILTTGLFLALPWIGAASAQQVNPYCLVSAGPPLQWAPCSATNPLQISGSFSATTTGFPGTTQTTGTPISVTTGGVTGTLPTGTVVVASNVGATNNAFCKLGASATTSDQLIPPNSWFAFTVGSNTQLTCITSTSTTTVNMVGGAGLPTGSGGGGGGSSSNASVSATGATVPASGTYVGLNSGGNLLGWPGTVNGGLIDWNTSSQAHTDLTSATVAGTNRIGYTSDDPCANLTKTYAPITATTSLVKVIATGVSAKKIYICQLLLTTTAANNVAVFEATTGTTCATSAVAVYGAGTSVATAANGFSFPANGGVSLGSGGNTVGITTVNNNDLCIGTSAATPLTGGISYVTQ